MVTVKLLQETEYHKTEQVIITGDGGTAVYTNTYQKVFHRDYPNGYIWRLI